MLMIAIFSLSLKSWAVILMWFILAPIAHRWDIGPSCYYVDTVKKMTLDQLVPGSPLRTLCLLIVGQPAAVFSATADGGICDAVNMSQQPVQANGSNMGHCGVNVDSDPSASNIKALTGLADKMLKQENVESVLLGGKRIAEQSNFEKLDWFAGKLVLEHQKRNCRIAPTAAFKQATHKPT